MVPLFDLLSVQKLDRDSLLAFIMNPSSAEINLGLIKMWAPFFLILLLFFCYCLYCTCWHAGDGNQSSSSHAFPKSAACLCPWKPQHWQAKNWGSGHCKSISSSGGGCKEESGGQRGEGRENGQATCSWSPPILPQSLECLSPLFYSGGWTSRQAWAVGSLSNCGTTTAVTKSAGLKLPARPPPPPAATSSASTTAPHSAQSKCNHPYDFSHILFVSFWEPVWSAS